jgi:hypothetical protein
MHLALAGTQDAVQQSVTLLEQRQDEIIATREAVQQRLAALEGPQAEITEKLQGERITLNTLGTGQ